MSDPITEEIHQMGRQARAAAHKLSQLSSDTKNAILIAMAQGLRNASSEILAANAKDIAAGDPLKPRDHPQKRGLAAARRPHEDRKLAFLDGQVDALQHIDGAIAFPDTVQRDAAHAGPPISDRTRRCRR
jgi:hypothetical protein